MKINHPSSQLVRGERAPYNKVLWEVGSTKRKELRGLNCLSEASTEQKKPVRRKTLPRSSHIGEVVRVKKEKRGGGVDMRGKRLRFKKSHAAKGGTR